MKINFDKYDQKLFSKVFYKLLEAKTRYVVVYGGASSSKSYSVHQLELLKLMGNAKGDTLVIRKFGADLRESCYKLFNYLIGEFKARELFTRAFGSDNRRITYHNGKSIIFKGIDDPEKLKSIMGVKRIVIEEASQLSFEDFLELNRRARGMEDIQITLILNPVSENHWIKEKFCDVNGAYHNETTVLRFTYSDNCNKEGVSFLTKTDIRELERLKDINENQYRIYVLAEWGVENKEGKFCWGFDRSQIKPTLIEPQYVVWASFDFNVNPLTCLVAQVFPGIQTVRAIECFRLENSDIYTMCDRLSATYPEVIWFVTGDATGNNRSAMVRDNITYYRIIEEVMNLGVPQMHVPKVNPPVEENQVMINAVHKNWNIEIDPDRCQPLIYDLTYVEVSSSGAIMKDRSNAKKYADFLDCWRYLLNTAVRPHFNYWVRKN